MSTTVLFPNHLAAERSARGFTREQFAEKVSIPLELYVEMEEGRMLPRYPELERLTAVLEVEPMRIFDYSVINTIGDKRWFTDKADYQRFYDSMAEASRLLVSPEEITWLDRETTPDRKVDVFLNLSCSTQFVPHIMLDAVAVLKTLGVSFASGSGRLFCCGTYYRRTGKFEGTDRMNAAAMNRTIRWGAETAVHMCTQCVNTFTEVSRRKAFETGEQPTVAHTQLLRFIDERLEELGDQVPWKRKVNARVLSHGHSTYSRIHDIAKRDVGNLLRRIPGVEFLGTLDRISLDSFCDSEPGVPKRPRPKTQEEVGAYRAELADIAKSWGADTVSPSHQTCLQMWSPFSSDAVHVTHVLSLLAEALGCAHPDRATAASRLGNPQAIVEQTRPIWSAWGMSEEKALETAKAAFDPAYTTADMCACGKNLEGQCAHDERVITVDVLKGIPRSH